jgi:hypothetical protein
MPSEKSLAVNVAVVACLDKREFLSDGLEILIWTSGTSRPLRALQVFEAAVVTW